MHLSSTNSGVPHREHNIYIIGAVNQKGFKEFLKLLDDYRGEKIKDDTTFESDIIKKNYSFESDSLEEEILNNNYYYDISKKKVKK